MKEYMTRAVIVTAHRDSWHNPRWRGYLLRSMGVLVASAEPKTWHQSQDSDFPNEVWELTDTSERIGSAVSLLNARGFNVTWAKETADA